MVLSSVLYVNRIKKGASRQQCRNLLGFRQSVVDNCLKTLSSYKLVGKNKREEFVALEPEIKDWFSWKKIQKDHWARNLNYMTIYLHKTGLPVAWNALYWLLVSLDAANQKKKRENRVSRRSLGKMLGRVGLSVVRRGLDRLVKDNLISFQEIKDQGKISGIVFTITQQVIQVFDATEAKDPYSILQTLAAEHGRTCWKDHIGKGCQCELSIRLTPPPFDWHPVASGMGKKDMTGLEEDIGLHLPGAKIYKATRGWKCQRCGVDLTNNFLTIYAKRDEFSPADIYWIDVEFE